MSSVHLHLVLCHIPVVGMMIAFVALILSFWKKDLSFRRWVFGFTFLISLTALPVVWTGEGAEESVALLPDVSMDLIESHEEAAETALGGTLVAGALAAIGLVLSFFNEKWVKVSLILAVIASTIAFGLLAWSSNLGGQIRHAEIRAKKNS